LFQPGPGLCNEIEDSDDEDDMESQNEDGEPSRALEEQELNVKL
jgi:hypothetical protein